MITADQRVCDPAATGLGNQAKLDQLLAVLCPVAHQHRRGAIQRGCQAAPVGVAQPRAEQHQPGTAAGEVNGLVPSARPARALPLQFRFQALPAVGARLGFGIGPLVLPEHQAASAASAALVAVGVLLTHGVRHRGVEADRQIWTK